MIRNTEKEKQMKVEILQTAAVVEVWVYYSS